MLDIVTKLFLLLEKKGNYIKSDFKRWNMVVYGKRNLNKLLEYLIIPNVAVRSMQFWILPIYKVKINYCE